MTDAELTALIKGAWMKGWNSASPRHGIEAGNAAVVAVLKPEIEKPLLAENKHLRETLGALKWKSIDKDNMEFECRTTYFVMDRIHAALKGEKL